MNESRATTEALLLEYQRVTELLNKTYDETEELRKVWDQLSKSISEKKDEKECHDQEHHRVLKSVHDYDITLRYADQYIEQITRDIDLKQTVTY